MSSHVNPREFALSVVSGNPVSGNTPEEKAQQALQLYLAAIEAATNHSKLIKKLNVDDSLKH